ncbi:TetR/AcrR family transcriptional regulator [Companilactobacillus jidongensis]|uniref:TetR/AcrR family transcriptional regulator n=1 Tax=Companilactobacillus jidongensis TaxID=2486006 RepID=UPI000F798D8E|nr:TetR/AcrR family transcriptional regulator [Companilactobacillus jidongensis]
MKSLIDIYKESPETSGFTDKQLKIFQAAITLFAQKGYKDTSTKEIAQVAGVSEGSLFKRFNNKEELLLSILKPLSRVILPEIITEFSESTLKSDYPTLYDFINIILRNRLEFFKDNMDVIRIFVDEFIYDENIRAEMIAEIPYEYMKNINDSFDKLKSRGLLVDWNNVEIFRFIFSTIFGYVAQHYFLFQSPNWDEKEEISHLVTFLVSGLTPKNTAE